MLKDSREFQKVGLTCCRLDGSKFEVWGSGGGLSVDLESFFVLRPSSSSTAVPTGRVEVPKRTMEDLDMVLPQAGPSKTSSKDDKPSLDALKALDPSTFNVQAFEGTYKGMYGCTTPITSFSSTDAL